MVFLGGRCRYVSSKEYMILWLRTAIGTELPRNRANPEVKEEKAHKFSQH